MSSIFLKNLSDYCINLLLAQEADGHTVGKAYNFRSAVAKTTLHTVMVGTGSVRYGDLSVFLYPADQPATAKDAGIQTKKQSLPVTIIDDGRLLRKNLPLVKKDETWVDKVLHSHNTTQEETFLLTVDNLDHILWLPKEGRK